MMEYYKLKFTPVSTFFFGGEKHRKTASGELKADYFTVSQDYPQQTTVLGLLRYLLLTQNPSIFNGKKITNPGAAIKLMGEKSFSYPMNGMNFGKIKRLSPLFLECKDKKWFFGPMNYPFEIKKGNPVEMKFNGKPFNAKEHWENIKTYLYNSDGSVISLEKILREQTRIGIEKRHKGDPPEEKFYKITTKSLKPGWKFAVEVEMEPGSGLKDNLSLFLPFGAERSMFKVEVKRINKLTEIPEPKNYQCELPYILCISDCFVETDIVKNAVFAVSDFVSFRNLKSNVKQTQKYSALTKTNKFGSLEMSDRYNLLKRGSVLYFDNSEELDKVKDAISKDKNLQSIGFNQIIVNK